MLKEPQKTVLSVHSDADGITAGVLYLKGNGIDIADAELYFPKRFGDVSFGPTVVVDQKPLDDKWIGLCIDHHDGHTDQENGFDATAKRKYQLNYGTKPASGLVYDLYKDKIPKEETWKLVIGLNGDGGAAYTPRQIWKDHPALVDITGYPKQNYGKTGWYPQAQYEMGSSLINYGCRMGDAERSFEILYTADTVHDIIFNSYLRGCKERVGKEYYGALKEAQLTEIGPFIYIEYGAQSKLWTASDIHGATHKTVIAVNRERGTMGIRGPLATIVSEKMYEQGIAAGGHEFFCGGEIDTEDMAELKKKVIKACTTWRD